MVGNSFPGEGTEHVIAAGRRDTLERSVESGRMTKGPEQAVVSCSVYPGESIDSSHDVNQIKINIDEKLVVEEAEKKLDKLEGVIAEGNDDVCLICEEEEDLENKVHDTLARHAIFLGIWSL